MTYESNDRMHELINKVFDSLFVEQTNYDEAIVVWQTLGLYLFSHYNKLSRLDALTNMLFYTKSLYKEIFNTKISEN